MNIDKLDEINNKMKQTNSKIIERIVEMNIEDIKINENNFYSTNDIEDLKSTISELGIISPLIVDQNNLLLSGHRRLKAAKELNLNTVPVQVKEFVEEDENKILIVANQYRKKTKDEEKQEALKLKSYYEKQKEDGKLSGKVMQHVADNLGISLSKAKLLVSEKEEEIDYVEDKKPKVSKEDKLIDNVIKSLEKLISHDDKKEFLVEEFFQDCSINKTLVNLKASKSNSIFN